MIEQLQAWCVYIVGFLAVVTPVMYAARPLAIAWIETSAKTKTPYDDKVAAVFLKICDAFAWLVAIMPRVTMGLGEAKRLRDQIKALDASPAQDPEQIR